MIINIFEVSETDGGMHFILKITLNQGTLTIYPEDVLNRNLFLKKEEQDYFKKTILWLKSSSRKTPSIIRDRLKIFKNKTGLWWNEAESEFLDVFKVDSESIDLGIDIESVIERFKDVLTEEEIKKLTDDNPNTRQL